MHDSILLAPKGDRWHWDSFSVGVFEWVKGKRSSVKVRIRGDFNQTGINTVHRKAGDIIKALDYGMYTGPNYIELRTSGSTNRKSVL